MPVNKCISDEKQEIDHRLYSPYFVDKIVDVVKFYMHAKLILQFLTRPYVWAPIVLFLVLLVEAPQLGIVKGFTHLLDKIANIL